jgi:hypothetical protein
LVLSSIECDGGRWACRRGRREYDRHDDFFDALSHSAELAEQAKPSEVIVHFRNGSLAHLSRFT